MGPGGPGGPGGGGGPGWGLGPGRPGWAPGPGWGPEPGGPGWGPGHRFRGGPSFFGGCANGLCNMISSCLSCLCCCWLFQDCFGGPRGYGSPGGGPPPF